MQNDRADDVVLHLLVVDLLHEPARAPAALVGDVQAVEDGPGLRDRHVRVHRRAGLLGDHVGEPGPRPGRREVDGLPGVVHRGRVAERGLRRRAHEALGQVHHVVVVGEGLVGLQHRELGVVPGVDALVAEHPPDLEHPLQPADDEPLEVQLQRDPQVEVDVQGVVVGDERAGRRAALDRLQHRALDLGEAQAVQVAADRVDRGVPDPEDLAGALVGLEVDVALPVAGLDVGEPAVLVGRRQQRLGQQRELARRGPRARRAGWSSRCRRRRPSRRGPARRSRGAPRRRRPWCRRRAGWPRCGRAAWRTSARPGGG